MAKTGLVLDERFQLHLTGPGHPERPERLTSISTALKHHGQADACTMIEASPAAADAVARVHDKSYLDRLERACRDSLPYIDVSDSAICPESSQIARLAAGGAINAVEAVISGTVERAFCAVRPPGHHAERDRSMGFCLFNNVAIAAAQLLEHHGLSRVLILDWDVHHGNGTQHCFYEDPRVLFISLHGHPRILYPGTGYAEERGAGAGQGFTMNIPMFPPCGDAEYRRAFDDVVLPAAERFAPQFVLVSAGFDAHRLDPLAPLDLDTASFGWMTDEIISVAKRFAQGRLVSLLEGGYHLEALADCASLHVSGLLET